ncbi:MAG: type II toxin-antitoxin system HicB family antitoxin [Moraxella sp.]|nr:type II toxin-antitoxin system HicB family antitoxin [Moraxella sp.]
MLYPVAITQKDHEFFAQIPDLPELHVVGSNMADTIAKVRVAIIEYLQQLSNSNQAIPIGQPLNNHLTNPVYFGCTWAIISLDSLRFLSENLPLTVNIPKTLIMPMQQALLDSCTVSHIHEITSLHLESYILKILTQHFTAQKS